MTTTTLIKSSSDAFTELRRNYKSLLIVAALLALLTAALIASPITVGDDWSVYYHTAERVRTGQPLYHLAELETNSSTYINPPWLMVILVPLSLLPVRVGWALLSVVSMLLPTLIIRRWKVGQFKAILALASPPMFYIVLHGQIDMLLLGAVLLPSELWLLAALVKPQVAIGIAAGIPRDKWVKAVILLGLTGVITLFLFGNWPIQLLNAPRPYLASAHNIWAGLWPQEVPIGIALLMLGISRKDERFLFAVGPFLSPYTPMSSLIGPWVAFSTFLADWQAAIVMIAWWAVVLVHGV